MFNFFLCCYFSIRSIQGVIFPPFMLSGVLVLFLIFAIWRSGSAVGCCREDKEPCETVRNTHNTLDVVGRIKKESPRLRSYKPRPIARTINTPVLQPFILLVAVLAEGVPTFDKPAVPVVDWKKRMQDADSFYHVCSCYASHRTFAEYFGGNT